MLPSRMHNNSHAAASCIQATLFEKIDDLPFPPLRGHIVIRGFSGAACLAVAQMERWEATIMNPRRLAMVPALTVVLAGCVVAWVAGFGSAGIEDSAAAPIVDRPPLADAEVAASRQTTVLANAAVDSADTAAPAAVVTATDTKAVSDEPEPIAEAAATSLAAIHQ